MRTNFIAEMIIKLKIMNSYHEFIKRRVKCGRFDKKNKHV